MWGPGVNLRCRRWQAGGVAAFCLLSSLAAPSGCWAGPPAPGQLPAGAHLSAGQVTLSQSASQLRLIQTGSRAILDWQSFDIGAGAAVTVSQPDAAAVLLNRILSADPTTVLGRLTANGQIFLVNPNGIVFGPGSQVNVAGLLASTLDIRDADFMSGSLVFRRNGASGAIVNQGNLQAADGGMIALLGSRLSNQGLIQARLGTVVLAAGETITLSTGAAGLSVAVDPATIRAQIDQGGLVLADGGRVLMTARAADAILGGVINNSGLIEARSATAKGGQIILEASDTIVQSGGIDASGATGGGGVSLVSAGTTSVGGRILATGGSGAGGTVETSGRVLQVGGAVIDASSTAGIAGRWLLDPTDLTVDAAAAATIAGALGGANVALQTTAGGSSGAGIANAAGNGDIIIAAPLAWTANTTLTLNAWRNIAVNANVTLSGNAAGLVMNPGQGTTGSVVSGSGASVTLSGSAPSLSIGGTGYTLLRSLADLQAIQWQPAGSYALANDIDASASANQNLGGGSSGFNPLGQSGTGFTGTIDGLGHSIGNMTIKAAWVGCVGLVSFNYGTVRNLAMVNETVSSTAGILELVGGLVGQNYGTVANSSTSGVVTAGQQADGVGGLVGLNRGVIDGSVTTATVHAGSAAQDVGGLVGWNWQGATISNSSSRGLIDSGAGTKMLGGFAGTNYGTLSADASSETVSAGPGALWVGGLVGYQGPGGLISRSYSDGPVTTSIAAMHLGGLLGQNDSQTTLPGTVTDSYSLSTVSAGAAAFGVGGLIGDNNGAVIRSYSGGLVSAGFDSLFVGGVIGQELLAGGSYTNNYWNPGASGRANATSYGAPASGITGLSGAALSLMSSYAGWNFNTVWAMGANGNLRLQGAGGASPSVNGLLTVQLEAPMPMDGAEGAP